MISFALHLTMQVWTFGSATADFKIWAKQRRDEKDGYKLKATIALKSGTLFVFTCAPPTSRHAPCMPTLLPCALPLPQGARR